MIYTHNDSFYPTPAWLAERMLDGIEPRKYEAILEPSAGSGALIKALRATLPSWMKDCDINEFISNIDCIEPDPDLQPMLLQLGCQVIHDDFLTFQTHKRYDLIIMNPPFSDGEKHLIKALNLIRPHGGTVVSLIMSSTLTNPNTKAKQYLEHLLDELDAKVYSLGRPFENADRPTSVEVMMVRVDVPKTTTTDSDDWERILLELMQANDAAYEQKKAEEQNTDISTGENIPALVAQYQQEAKMGLALIDLGAAFGRKCLTYVKSEFNPDPRSLTATPLLSIYMAGQGCSFGSPDTVTPNQFLEKLREKYWRYVFDRNDLRRIGTTDMQSDIRNCVKLMRAYEFTEANVFTMLQVMRNRLQINVEKTIMSLFYTLSAQHSYNESVKNGNIHLYNGWKHNKAWCVNQRVVIPLNAWDHHFGRFVLTRSSVVEKLSDLEKALNYLDGNLTRRVDIEKKLKWAQDNEVFKNIPLTFFNVTFHKKGTCHIEFRDLDLLLKLNIFVAQNKNWLPPSYGKATYEDMPEEELETVLEFQKASGVNGIPGYMGVVLRKDYFIVQREREGALVQNNPIAGLLSGN